MAVSPAGGCNGSTVVSGSADGAGGAPSWWCMDGWHNSNINVHMCRCVVADSNPSIGAGDDAFGPPSCPTRDGNGMPWSCCIYGASGPWPGGLGCNCYPDNYHWPDNNTASPCGQALP